MNYEPDRDYTRNPFTRSELRDMLMEQDILDARVRAMALMYIQTMPTEQIADIANVLPAIIERLDAGDGEGIVTLLEQMGVPGAILQIIKAQVGVYAEKLSSHSA